MDGVEVDFLLCSSSALGRFGTKETHGCSKLCFYPSIVLLSIKWISFLWGTTEQQFGDILL
jgi:hypothetical protein